jgi:hypothetical protein
MKITFVRESAEDEALRNDIYRFVDNCPDKDLKDLYMKVRKCDRIPTDQKGKTTSDGAVWTRTYVQVWVYPDGRIEQVTEPQADYHKIVRQNLKDMVSLVFSGFGKRYQKRARFLKRLV